MVSLGERTAEGREFEREGGYVLDLRGADLRRVWLPCETCLKRVRLSDVRLSGATGLPQHHLDEVFAFKCFVKRWELGNSALYQLIV